MKNFLIGLICLFTVSAWAQPRVNGVAVVKTTNEPYWRFNNAGSVLFPDTTIQQNVATNSALTIKQTPSTLTNVFEIWETNGLGLGLYIDSELDLYLYHNLVMNGFDANHALISGPTKGITESLTSAEEIGYVQGVTSPIQAQIDGVSAAASTKQNGSAVLTGLVATVARNVTNVVSLSTTNATSKPLTSSYTAGVLTLFGLEQGANITLTPNPSNIVVAVTGVTNTPVLAAGRIDATNNIKIRGAQFASVAVTQINFAVSQRWVMTNGNGLNANLTLNLTNFEDGLSAIVDIPANKLGTNFTVTVNVAAGGVTTTNIIWKASPTNGNSTFIAQSNATYQLVFVSSSTPTATNIFASWTSDSLNPVRGLVLSVAAGGSESNAVVGGGVYKVVSLTARTNLNATIATFTNGLEFIVPGNTLTNDGDSLIVFQSGEILGGTNQFRLIDGYTTPLDTSTITNGNTVFESAMTITRTAAIGALVQSAFSFSQSGASNWVTIKSSTFINRTNGAAVTNKIMFASNRTGSISNNFAKWQYEPASR